MYNLYVSKYGDFYTFPDAIGTTDELLIHNAINYEVIVQTCG